MDPRNLLPTSLLDEFPILKQTINGRPLVYLDNAATVQKPECVLNAVDHYYRTDNANVHRGVHTLSQRATDSFEAAREQLRMRPAVLDDALGENSNLAAIRRNQT